MSQPTQEEILSTSSSLEKNTTNESLSEFERVRQRILSPAISSSSSSSSRRGRFASADYNPSIKNIPNRNRSSSYTDIDRIRDQFLLDDIAKSNDERYISPTTHQGVKQSITPRSLPSTPERRVKKQYAIPRSPNSSTKNLLSPSLSEMERVRKKILEQGSSFNNSSQLITRYPPSPQTSSKSMIIPSFSSKSISSMDNNDWIPFSSSSPTENHSKNGTTTTTTSSSSSLTDVDRKIESSNMDKNKEENDQTTSSRAESEQLLISEESFKLTSKQFDAPRHRSKSDEQRPSTNKLESNMNHQDEDVKASVISLSPSISLDAISFCSLTDIDDTFHPKAMNGTKDEIGNTVSDDDTLELDHHGEKPQTVKQIGQTFILPDQQQTNAFNSIQQDTTAEPPPNQQEIEEIKQSFVPNVVEYKQDEMYFDKARQKILDAHKSELLANENDTTATAMITLQSLEEDFLQKTANRQEQASQPGAMRVRKGSDEDYYLRAKRKAYEEDISTLENNANAHKSELLANENDTTATAMITLQSLEEDFLQKTAHRQEQASQPGAMRLRKGSDEDYYLRAKRKAYEEDISTLENNDFNNMNDKKQNVKSSLLSLEEVILTKSRLNNSSTNPYASAPQGDIESNETSRMAKEDDSASIANSLPTLSSNKHDKEDIEDSTVHSDDNYADPYAFTNLEDQGLAIAIPIEHDQALLYNLPPIFAEEYNPAEEYNTLYKIRNRRLKCITFCLFIFVIITVMVGAIVGTKLNRHPPITDDGTDNMPLTEREEQIIKRIQTISPNATLSTNNNESKALKWILYDDGSQLQGNDSTLIQRYVLALFYFSTSGQYWNYCSYSYNSTECQCPSVSGGYDVKNRFLTNTSECTWGGIECIYGQRVQRIFLPSNNMTGTLPPEIGEMQSLQILLLQKNIFTSTLPSNIGKLQNLVYLDLLENRFTGSLPKEIYTLALLEKITLSSNRFKGSISDDIGNLRNLKAIYLFNNTFTGSFPESIGSISTLVYLYIYQNQFSGRFPTTIGNLKRLNELYAFINFFSGPIPTELGLLTSLQSLAIDNNKFTGTLPNQLSNLENLSWLKLNANDLDGTIPPSYGNLKYLKTLDLRYNRISNTIPSELGQLTNLNNGLFSYNQLTGLMPNEICKLRYSQLTTLFADCLGENPTIECNCCSACCDPINQVCYTSNPLN